MEPHWFLTQPLDMIMTHLPTSAVQQSLSPAVNQHGFFSLPHVRHPFFWHGLRILHYKDHIDSGVFYVSLKQEANTSCYAETEGRDGTIVRGLAQSMTENDERVSQIKAVLPPGQTDGWLKIYAGRKVIPTSQHSAEKIQKHHYPLAMCIRIQQAAKEEGFEFVQLYVDHNEFYIQSPQCYRLYPLQTYDFCIRGGHRGRAVHHKLAIKSPGGRLIKLMYYPQDQTYDGKVTMTETGIWSLICLLHHTGGWYTVATWSCIVK